MKTRKLLSLLMVLVLLCSACGTAPSSDVPEAGSVVLSDVRDLIVDRMSVQAPFMIETDALMDLYGIDPLWVSSSAGFVTMNGTFPDEVILIEAADEAAAAEIQAKLQSRLEQVMVQARTYDAENYALAQECSVQADGIYLCLILSPSYKEITDLYKSCLNMS